MPGPLCSIDGLRRVAASVTFSPWPVSTTAAIFNVNPQTKGGGRPRLLIRAERYRFRRPPPGQAPWDVDGISKAAHTQIIITQLI